MTVVFNFTNTKLDKNLTFIKMTIVDDSTIVRLSGVEPLFCVIEPLTSLRMTVVFNFTNTKLNKNLAFIKMSIVDDFTIVRLSGVEALFTY